MSLYSDYVTMYGRHKSVHSFLEELSIKSTKVGGSTINPKHRDVAEYIMRRTAMCQCDAARTKAAVAMYRAGLGINSRTIVESLNRLVDSFGLSRGAAQTQEFISALAYVLCDGWDVNFEEEVSNA